MLLTHTCTQRGRHIHAHTHTQAQTYTYTQRDRHGTHKQAPRQASGYTHTRTHSEVIVCRGHLSNPTGGWSSCHIFGGHAFNIVQATEVCWDSSGSHTSSKVENQIVKLLTKVLSQAKNRPGPRQGGGIILSLQSIIGAGHNYIRSFKVWS